MDFRMCLSVNVLLSALKLGKHEFGGMNCHNLIPETKRQEINRCTGSAKLDNQYRVCQSKTPVRKSSASREN